MTFCKSSQIISSETTSFYIQIYSIDRYLLHLLRVQINLIFSSLSVAQWTIIKHHIEYDTHSCVYTIIQVILVKVILNNITHKLNQVLISINYI